MRKTMGRVFFRGGGGGHSPPLEHLCPPLDSKNKYIFLCSTCLNFTKSDLRAPIF